MTLRIHDAQSHQQIAHIRALFTEYAASLEVDLCFQGFAQELAKLPGAYAPPQGRLLIAEYDGQMAGCVALRKIDEGVYVSFFGILGDCALPSQPHRGRAVPGVSVTTSSKCNKLA